MGLNMKLLTFIKGSSNPADKMPGCANYDHHHGGCLFADKNICKVEDGIRCLYFEKAVLPTAVEINQQDRINTLYLEQVGNDEELSTELATKKNQNKCPGIGGIVCGVEILSRKRLCDKCRIESNRINKRNWNRKNRGR